MMNRRDYIPPDFDRGGPDGRLIDAGSGQPIGMLDAPYGWHYDADNLLRQSDGPIQPYMAMRPYGPPPPEDDTELLLLLVLE